MKYVKLYCVCVCQIFGVTYGDILGALKEFAMGVLSLAALVLIPILAPVLAVPRMIMMLRTKQVYWPRLIHGTSWTGEPDLDWEHERREQIRREQP